MRPFQPTASNTDLFLACQWPWLRTDIPRKPATEPMIYGTGFHAVLAQIMVSGITALPLAVDTIAPKYKLDKNELAPHVRGAYSRLMRWLNGDNEFGRKLNPRRTCIETAGALKLSGPKRARKIPPPTEDTHIYETDPDELAGTVDWSFVEGEDLLVVEDHKSGAEIDPPSDRGQHATLAVIGKHQHKTKDGLLVTLHAPRRGLPEIMTTKVSAKQIDAHEDRLRLAFSRVSDGSLRPGSECPRCAANSRCPVYGSNIVGGSLDLSTPEARGLTHDMLKTYDAIREDVGERLKASVKTLGPGEKSNGKLLVIQSFERETVSLKSIRDAFGGGAAAEREIRRLRLKGAITKTPIEQLGIVNDRGK